VLLIQCPDARPATRRQANPHPSFKIAPANVVVQRVSCRGGDALLSCLGLLAWRVAWPTAVAEGAAPCLMGCFFSPTHCKCFFFFSLECDIFFPVLTHKIITPRAVLPRVCSSASLLTPSLYPYKDACRAAAPADVVAAAFPPLALGVVTHGVNCPQGLPWVAFSLWLQNPSPSS